MQLNVQKNIISLTQVRDYRDRYIEEGKQKLKNEHDNRNHIFIYIYIYMNK